MKLDRIIVGPLATNCYLLKKNNKCIIVDPGDEAKKIIDNINEKVIGIIITHYHFDHIGALNELKAFYKCPVYDYSNLNNEIKSIQDFAFEIIHTPGHKEDLISIYIKEINSMLVGDFIFKNSIGRMDLEGGSIKDMILSINKILNYDENIVLYPGHGGTYLSQINYNANNISS